MNKLVSVIIPVYDSAKYISEAIESVLAQTYGDLEIIVINDGSIDQTGCVVQKIKDRRIKYSKTQRRGNYFARNRGIQKSKGSYVAFLDADDIWLKDKLKAQIGTFDRHKDLGLCCTGHYIFFGSKKKDVYMDTLHSFSEELASHERFIERLLQENIIITSSVMVRKSCIQQIGMFDTSFQNAMDYEMWLRLILNYKAAYLKECYVLKRRHISNISGNRINTCKAVLYIFNKLSSYIEETKYFNTKHLALLEKKLQKTTYDIGLEYLAVKDYKNALRHFGECRISEKTVVKRLAIFTAKARLGISIPLLNLYRKKRQKSKLVSAKQNGMA